MIFWLYPPTPATVLPNPDTEVCTAVVYIGVTHTDEASLALGVAKHFVHGALIKRVDSLTGQLVSICRVHWTTPFGLNQDVREEEEHPEFGLRAFRGHHFQPTFTSIPAT